MPSPCHLSLSITMLVRHVYAHIDDAIYATEYHRKDICTIQCLHVRQRCTSPKKIYRKEKDNDKCHRRRPCRPPGRWLDIVDSIYMYSSSKIYVKHVIYRILSLSCRCQVNHVRSRQVTPCRHAVQLYEDVDSSDNDLIDRHSSPPCRPLMPYANIAMRAAYDSTVATTYGACRPTMFQRPPMRRAACSTVYAPVHADHGSNKK